MMLQRLKIRSLVALFLFGSSCSYDINTVDPQSSTSIALSKKDGLYVCEFSADNGLGFVSRVDEAWVEIVWFNQLTGGKREKRKIDEVQLSLKLKDFSDSNFKRDEYIVNWLMKDNKDKVLGRSNGVYVLPLDKKQIPDSIRISVCKLGDNREVAACVYQFTLRKTP
jgi:hypothetical protein